ncbi:transmembrane protease serine 9-like [Uranotaenia lowii]|uniref:transmembrane protease serine 9-like n=1 Tax=Uranotaenia lowii TaxID=190385 RepID=UPI002479A134|nr:transmembrane protease serine 9-like [Uranotaenia lowii]
MEAVYKLVVLLLVLLFGDSVHCQEACRTPNQRDGRCIPRVECRSFSQYFTPDRILSQDELNFVRMSQCQPRKICCPDRVVSPDPLPVTTTSTPQPTTVLPSTGGSSDQVKLPDPSKFECGLDHLGDRIYGGVNASIDEFPWFALLEYQSKKGIKEFKCGGSLISRRYVMTAAHCLANKKLDDGERFLGVRLGDHNTETEVDCEGVYCADPPQNFGYEEIIFHPGFSKDNQAIHHDIALIRLDREAVFNDFVTPVCLPDSRFSSTVVGRNVTIVGFGHTSRRIHSGIKQKAFIPIFDPVKCREKWSSKLQLVDEQLCAGGDYYIDSCGGDSGGPLMTQRLYWTQEGIVSFGNRCGLEGWPGIYTRVASYVDWIKQNVRPYSAPVWEVAQSCTIPNELQKGVCAKPQNCPAYTVISDHTDLSSVGRVSFIKQIQCNRSSEPENTRAALPADGTVCCPRSGNYRKPTISANIPRRARPPAPDIHSRLSGMDDDVCGYQAYGPKIKGGEIANIDEFPWMALLIYALKTSNSLVHGCGGVLISRNFVLTAAHCVSGKEYESKGPLKFVRLREYNIYQDPDCVIENNFQDCSDDKIDAEPRNILLHPMYDSEFRSKYHDIALIEIDDTPEYSDFLRPICLPEAHYDNGVAKGRYFSVAGWGRTDIFRKQLGNNALSPIKLKVILPFVDAETCQKVFRPQRLELSSGQLCAGGQNARDTCSGDSGSPLMHYDPQHGVWVLTGLVSLGVRDCGTEGVPGVYTNVREYLPWIKQNARMMR